MKNTKLKFIISVCILTIFAKSASSQVTLETQLSSINLNLYLNKPIDSLIAALPTGYTQLIVRSGSNFFNAGGLIISYPNDYCIDISAKSFQFVTRKNVSHLPTTQAWPLHLMRKEQVDIIVVYKDWNIINGAGYGVVVP